MVDEKNQNGDLISVIVPIYNGEQYVHSCLENILAQTYGNIEILVVNDGSTDKTLEIVEEIAKKNLSIKIVSQPNGGQWNARNTGLDHATGEYIGFVDVDDYITPSMFEIMHTLAKNNNADIVVCDRFRNINYKNDFENMNLASEDIYSFNAKSAVIHLFSDTSMIKPAVWDKLYRRELFENVRCENTFYEDVSITYKLLYKAQNIVVTRKQLYGYSIHEGSLITSDWNKRKTDSYYQNMKNIKNFFRDTDEELRESVNYWEMQWGIECWESMVPSDSVTDTEKQEFIDYIRNSYKDIKLGVLNLGIKKRIKKEIEFFWFAKWPYFFLKIKSKI